VLLELEVLVLEMVLLMSVDVVVPADVELDELDVDVVVELELELEDELELELELELDVFVELDDDELDDDELELVFVELLVVDVDVGFDDVVPEVPVVEELFCAGEPAQPTKAAATTDESNTLRMFTVASRETGQLQYEASQTSGEANRMTRSETRSGRLDYAAWT
jgi:hypothetical protein